MRFHESEINFETCNIIGNLFCTDLKKYSFENLVVPKKHLRSIYNKVDILAIKQGWVSNWGDFTPAEIEDLLKEWLNTKLSDEEQKQKISNFFIEYYSNNNFSRLEDFIYDWTQNPVFQKRIKIFQACLFALKNSSEIFNPSNLVVPVLIAQIDGIISDFLEHEGWTYTKKKWIRSRKPGSQVSFNSSTKCFGDIIKNKKTCLGPYYFGRLIQFESRYDILIEGLFHAAYRGDKLPDQIFINRHKILHGEETDYGTIANVLKLFFILDYLSRFKISNLVKI